MNNPFAELTDEQGGKPGYAKIGIQGFGGSGKSYTAALAAIAIQKHFGYKTPIAMFDTENGSGYLAGLFKAFKVEFFPVRARSFDRMMLWAKIVETKGIKVAIVDSITHPWEELKTSYLVQINAERKMQDKPPLSKLGFTAWQKVKPHWNQWPDWMLNAPVHLIVAGRARLDFAEEENEEGDKELRTTGVSMRTEGQFTFENSLLIEMSRRDDRSGPRPRILRDAIVLKDRFGVIDGAFTTFVTSGADHAKHLGPVTEFLKPHIELLEPEAHSVVDMTPSQHDIVDGDTAHQRAKDRREILLERIQAELVRLHPSTGGADKKAKIELLKKHFNEVSWKAIEKFHLDALAAGLASLLGKDLDDGPQAETTIDENEADASQAGE